MAKKRIVITAISLGIILYVFYFFSSNSPCLDFNQGAVSIDETQRITVDFAITPAEQARGLAGCSSLKLGQGMYFPYSQKTDAVFWMKNMIIPIDIIWIADNKVIGIEHSVPPPKDENLIKYHAPYAVDAVLEIGAGHATQLGITEGTNIQVQDNKH